jgi:hypothetical protein
LVLECRCVERDFGKLREGRFGIRDWFDSRLSSAISFDRDRAVLLYVTSESTRHRLESVESLVGLVAGQFFEFVEEVGFFVGLIRRNDFIDIDRFGESSSEEDRGSPK